MARIYIATATDIPGHCVIDAAATDAEFLERTREKIGDVSLHFSAEIHGPIKSRSAESAPIGMNSVLDDLIGDFFPKEGYIDRNFGAYRTKISPLLFRVAYQEAAVIAAMESHDQKFYDKALAVYVDNSLRERRKKIQEEEEVRRENTKLDAYTISRIDHRFHEIDRDWKLSWNVWLYAMGEHIKSTPIKPVRAGGLLNYLADRRNDDAYRKLRSAHQTRIYEIKHNALATAELLSKDASIFVGKCGHTVHFFVNDLFRVPRDIANPGGRFGYAVSGWCKACRVEYYHRISGYENKSFHVYSEKDIGYWRQWDETWQYLMTNYFNFEFRYD